MSHLLDAKGLSCPLPVLRARKAMKQLAPGEVLEVLATDPGAVEDFKAFCEVTGYVLVDSRGRTLAPQARRKIVAASHPATTANNTAASP
jgi:tRNA 2-thiouridine synthesizing protein A